MKNAFAPVQTPRSATPAALIVALTSWLIIAAALGVAVGAYLTGG